MFDLISHAMLAGLLLTQTTHPRELSEVESGALDDDERYLHAELERWMSLSAHGANEPGGDRGTVAVETDAQQGDGNESSDVARDERANESDAALNVTALHEMILASLERVQTDLATLTTRWRSEKKQLQAQDKAQSQGSTDESD
jgi:hypothetical protein